ncbi:MAG: hypothetical protein RBT74_12485 [Tenuifilaceae bacterium]|jgi:hypothetical protein|nr:hypothetical protein [Tenuifilaceae bacterium]
MNTATKIPETEKREKTLALRITQAEYDALDHFCKQNKVKKSDLVRFAFRKAKILNL